MSESNSSVLEYSEANKWWWSLCFQRLALQNLVNEWVWQPCTVQLSALRVSDCVRRTDSKRLKRCVYIVELTGTFHTTAIFLMVQVFAVLKYQENWKDGKAYPIVRCHYGWMKHRTSNWYRTVSKTHYCNRCGYRPGKKQYKRRQWDKRSLFISLTTNSSKKFQTHDDHIIFWYFWILLARSEWHC